MDWIHYGAVVCAALLLMAICAACFADAVMTQRDRQASEEELRAQQ